MSNQRRRGGPIGGLIKLVGSGVGAAAEYRDHRKERKAARDSAQASPEEQPVVAGPSSRPNEAQRSTSNDAPPSYAQSTGNSSRDRQLATGPQASDEKKRIEEEIHSDSDSDFSSDDLGPLEDDEEAWQLDEVAASTEPPSYEEANSEDADSLVRDVLSARGDVISKPVGKLSLPVILPQRRPRNKTRGFVRAYSPVLEDVGIDQQTFLRFLKNFHKSSQANPCFNAVIVAATVAGFVPSPIIVSISFSSLFFGPTPAGRRASTSQEICVKLICHSSDGRHNLRPSRRRHRQRSRHPPQNQQLSRPHERDPLQARGLLRLHHEIQVRRRSGKIRLGQPAGEIRHWGRESRLLDL